MIEPVIGHIKAECIKAEHRMEGNYLKGREGLMVRGPLARFAHHAPQRHPYRLAGQKIHRHGIFTDHWIRLRSNSGNSGSSFTARQRSPLPSRYSQAKPKQEVHQDAAEVTNEVTSTLQRVGGGLDG